MKNKLSRDHTDLTQKLLCFPKHRFYNFHGKSNRLLSYNRDDTVCDPLTSHYTNSVFQDFYKFLCGSKKIGCIASIPKIKFHCRGGGRFRLKCNIYIAGSLGCSPGCAEWELSCCRWVPSRILQGILARDTCSSSVPPSWRYAFISLPSGKKETPWLFILQAHPSTCLMQT